MTESPLRNDRASSNFWLGLVAALVALGTLAAIVWRRVENKEWSAGTDTALLVVALVSLVVWAWVNRAELKTMLLSRGTALNTNALITLAAVAFILFVVNYWLIPRHLDSVKLDLTSGKYYTLSEQSRNVVRAITADNPVELVAFVPTDTFRQQGDLARSLELNRRRLEEYGALSPHLKVTTLDPNTSARARAIRDESGLTSLPLMGCVIRFQKEPKAYESVASLDESQITRGLSKLLDSKGAKRKVYFLTGHGELPLTPPAGANPADPVSGMSLAGFKSDLEQNRFEVADQPLIATGVPADANVLVSIGAKAPFSEAELNSLRTYLKNDGRFLVALDPDGNSGLDKVLAEYGIDWQPNPVDDRAFNAQPGTEIFVSFAYGTHELVKGLSQYPSVFDRAGYFKRGTLPTGLEYFDLVRTSPGATAKVRAAAAADGTTPAAPAGTANGPFDLAVAVGTRDEPAPEAEAGKPTETKAEHRTRIVAVSTPSFFALAGPTVANTVIAADSVNWLTDNSKDLGIKPKNPWEDERTRQIQMTEAKRNKVLLFTFLLPLILCLAAGIAVGVARSRR